MARDLDKIVTPETMYGGLRVVAFANQKGGTGKSTLALHTALRAAFGEIPEVKKKVLIIDVDEQQNSSKTLLAMEEIEENGSALPPLHEEYDPSDPDHVEWGGRSNSVDLYFGNPVLPYQSVAHERLDVLPSDGEVLKTFEKSEETKDRSVLEAIYQEFFNFFSQPDVQALYDLVIFDCPPGKTLITTPVFRAATDIVIPTQVETFSMDGVEKIFWNIKKENPHRPCDLNIVGIIPNQVDKRIKKHVTNARTLRSRENLAEHVAPFNINKLNDIGIDTMPAVVNDTCKLKTEKAEFQISQLIKFIRKKIYTEPSFKMKEAG